VLGGIGNAAPLYIVLNAAPDPIALKTPTWPPCRAWKALIDTTAPDGGATGALLEAGQPAEAPPRAVLVFEGVR